MWYWNSETLQWKRRYSWIVAKREWPWNTNKTFKYLNDIALKRIKKYYGKKKKKIFIGIFIKKLTCDITEHCKLPEAIELNHDNIMVWEETSIAEKIIKLFPHENIVLNKKFNNRKPDIWLESNDPNFDLFKFLGKINLHILKLHEENAENKGNNKAVTK